MCDVQTVGGAALSGDEVPGAGRAGSTVDTPTTTGATRRAVVALTGTALVAFGVDQLTKHLALAALEGTGEPVRLLGGALYLSLTRNSGAAFSLGRDYTFVFPIITLVVIGWIGWLALRLRSLPWAVSLGLILGGALGNLTDRLLRAPGPLLGHVVDMISVFGPYGERFPVFNVADSCLFIGVALAVLLELTGRQRDGTRQQREREPADSVRQERA